MAILICTKEKEMGFDFLLYFVQRKEECLFLLCKLSFTLYRENGNSYFTLYKEKGNEFIFTNETGMSFVLL